MTITSFSTSPSPCAGASAVARMNGKSAPKRTSTVRGAPAVPPSQKKPPVAAPGDGTTTRIRAGAPMMNAAVAWPASGPARNALSAAVISASVAMNARISGVAAAPQADRPPNRLSRRRLHAAPRRNQPRRMPPSPRAAVPPAARQLPGAARHRAAPVRAAALFITAAPGAPLLQAAADSRPAAHGTTAPVSTTEPPGRPSAAHGAGALRQCLQQPPGTGRWRIDGSQPGGSSPQR